MPPHAVRSVYPPRYTISQAKAWTISGLSGVPPLPEQGPSKVGAWVRRLVRDHVKDPTHRRQLEAYCRAQASPKVQDLSFARACANWGWPERTAERNVDRALTAVLIAMNAPETE